MKDPLVAVWSARLAAIVDGPRGASIQWVSTKARSQPVPLPRFARSTGRPIMETKQGYFNDLDRLLAAMPAGTLDMGRVEANERRHGHRFYDPPETVHQWLLDQQRRIHASALRRV